MLAGLMCLPVLVVQEDGMRRARFVLIFTNLGLAPAELAGGVGGVVIA
ncbi:hypothetical protein [Ornithinimicrobium sp. INDO-MA30-4]|nr:hypothetical protein [Ornithinimicrobium sp. INDO-MA30-4]UJH70323.1 hypothetical protein L0A91_14465 [Ornithinimicrobium sp. INDO-MA30-4]